MKGGVMLIQELQPVRALARQAVDALKQAGYAAATIKAYESSYQCLMEYMEARGLDHFTQEVGLAYMNHTFGFKPDDWIAGGLPRRTRAAWNHLLMLWHVQQTASVVGRVRRRTAPFQCPPAFELAYATFQCFCARQKYTPQGLPTLINPVQRWLLFLKSQGVSDLRQLQPEHLTTFVAMYAGHSRTYLATIVAALRVFLKQLAEAGLVAGKPWTMLPPTPHRRQFFLPASWTPSDVQKLLNAIDRGNPTGKRDYALLLLVVRLGLRASDVRHLTLRQIHWADRQLRLVQTKTRQPLILPLLDDVGWALIDYLKHGRPHTTADAVFVNHKAPYAAFRDTNGMQQILWKYMRFAGLAIPHDEHRGLHSLRSTLARTLLEQGTPLPVISGVLGHQSAQSARSYLHINLEALRRCPLDPEAVFRGDH